jgi:hypothetical protein
LPTHARASGSNGLLRAPAAKRWQGGDMSTSSVRSLRRTAVAAGGTVGLDFCDAGAKQLIWRGSASKTLDENAKPEKRRKNLDKAMAKLLKNYPPPQPKKK